jgi:long-chain acyl-CoA synthetase
MGASVSFGDLDRQSAAFAAYLQSLGLVKGDRVALMMPNVPQYGVAVAGVLRAGMVVVNTNPLYTPRELEHQLTDSGARAIVILENMAHTLEACRAVTTIEHIVLTAVGDMLPPPKRMLVNFVLRRVKKMVPAYLLPGAVRWTTAIAKGKATAFRKVDTTLEDVAVLQYTGGTTGVSKGATLLHRNIIANVLQSELWHSPAMQRIPPGEQVVTISALPLYHIFGFTVNLMLAMRTGGCNVLIVNPRDLPSVFKALKAQPFHSFPAVNTLFAALARHPDARSVDWSSLKLSVGGGMAVQPATAKAWIELTGSAICEGYGLSETSPSASCNPVDDVSYTGTIGLPLPSTDFRILDDEDRDVAAGERGEIAIRGPQVMAGYWNRPDETARALTQDGYFKTGDIGLMRPDGYFAIVDRKKDMINVSGFNVYPNEIEEIVTQMPGIIEAAVIGVPDESSGEAVKLFVVTGDAAVTVETVKAFCKSELTGYKRPKHIEFREELPKSNVGKVLRRKLRDD